MENMLYWGHRFLGGIKHFWMAMRVWKTNLVLEDLAHQKTDKSVTKVMALMRSDRSLTVKMIGSELNLHHRTIHDILTKELGMQKICAKLVLVPKNLTNEQKENWRNVCLDLLEGIENDENVFKYVITGDESWIFEYDLKTKRKSSWWYTSNSPYPKKATESKFKIKSVLICFFSIQGVVHKKFVPQGQTFNSTIVRSLNDTEKGFIVFGQRLWTLGCCITTMLPVTQPSLWTIFWPKSILQWF